MKIVNLLYATSFMIAITCPAVSQAQVKPGTYQFISLGTAGSHAQEAGSKGVMTVGSKGQISGSGYSYQDGITTTFSGTINMANGKGSLTAADGKTYSISAKTSAKTFLDLGYTKINSSSGSKGIIWGFR